MMLIYIFNLDAQETYVKNTNKQPKKSAAFSGRILVLFWSLKYRCFLDFQNQRYRLASYLMEHIFSEAQLCSEILIFKETPIFWYTDHPENPGLKNWSRIWIYWFHHARSSSPTSLCRSTVIQVHRSLDWLIKDLEVQCWAVEHLIMDFEVQ